MTKVSIQQIDAVLPQTQCQECGYAGCRPYAQALVEENEDIHLCPPGGIITLKALADLLKRDAAPFEKTVRKETRAPSVAKIREAECIGCTKCIQACPVDAILGTAKQMHTVIESECTGCGLCVAPCPVDCIDLPPVPTPSYTPDTARERHAFRQFRLQRDKEERLSKHRKAVRIKKMPDKDQEKVAKQAYIKAAIARAHAKKKTARVINNDQ